MKIQTNDRLTIGEIQKAFSREFPYLRIDLFTSLSEHPNGAFRVADENISLGTIRTNHSNGEMVISSSDITGEVEQKLKDNFGLHAQIFRRAGKNWILTTTTDKYTLQRQNEIGEEMIGGVPDMEPEDIHEQT